MSDQPQPLSLFVRLMQDALEQIQTAQTPEDRQAAEAHMARLIKAQVAVKR